MKRVTWTLLAVVLFAVYACGPPDPEQAYQNARRFFDQGLLDEAIAQYEVVVILSKRP